MRLAFDRYGNLREKIIAVLGLIKALAFAGVDREGTVLLHDPAGFLARHYGQYLFTLVLWRYRGSVLTLYSPRAERSDYKLGDLGLCAAEHQIYEIYGVFTTSVVPSINNSVFAVRGGHQREMPLVDDGGGIHKFKHRRIVKFIFSEFAIDEGRRCSVNHPIPILTRIGTFPRRKKSGCQY